MPAPSPDLVATSERRSAAADVVVRTAFEYMIERKSLSLEVAIDRPFRLVLSAYANTFGARATVAMFRDVADKIEREPHRGNVLGGLPLWERSTAAGQAKEAEARTADGILRVAMKYMVERATIPIEVAFDRLLTFVICSYTTLYGSAVSASLFRDYADQLEHGNGLSMPRLEGNRRRRHDWRLS